MVMRQKMWLVALLGIAALPGATPADSLWDRRDPNSAHLFYDYRARRVGDVLTVLIEEATGSDALEKREMEKKTKAGAGISGTGSAQSLGQVLSNFTYGFDLAANSQRTFDGKANSTIDRKFNDRLSVVVVAVLPNGKLAVTGHP